MSDTPDITPAKARRRSLPRVLVTYEEAAEMYSVSEDFLRRLVRGGKLPCIKYSRRMVRLEVKELDKFFAEHKELAA